MKLALAAFMTIIWLIANFIAGQHTSANLNQLTDSKALRLFTVDLFNYFSISCALAITAITRISFLIKTIIIMIIILLQVIMNITILSNVLMMRSSSSPSNLDPLNIDRNNLSTLMDSYHFDQYVFFLTLVTICVALFLINKQFELTNRRLFLWRKQVEQRKEKVADMREKNEALVYNILPPNVAKIFLEKKMDDEELYSKSYDAVGVLFAAMPNFSDFYCEDAVNNQGLECLRFLNDIISDYDALLDMDKFKNIIKIKTMGSTYMAASGLYEDDEQEEKALRNKLKTLKTSSVSSQLSSSSASSKSSSVNNESQPFKNKIKIKQIGSSYMTTTGLDDGDQENEDDADDVEAGESKRLRATSVELDSNQPVIKSNSAGTTNSISDSDRKQQDDIKSKWGHLEQLTEFALALKKTLNNINKESFNNFVLRIGINHGPITAGVIGAKKPHFDMWGNTVNVASRMESTGRAGSIQVVNETSEILRNFNFEFEQRGEVYVKGKGKLLTFYLTGKAGEHRQEPEKDK